MKKIMAKITANEEAAKGFFRMRVASTYLARTAKPGQFVEIRCSDGPEPLLRRPLGVHRITAGGIEMLYQVVGKGTDMLSRRKAGDEADIIGPMGNGFDIKQPASAMLVAGGIGVAPLVALAGRLKRARVIIGARTASHVLCEKEFRALGCSVAVSTDDGSRGRRGLATDLLKDELLTKKSEPSVIYACGPTGMLKAVAHIASHKRIRCQVSLEERMACGVGVCLGCPVKVRPGNAYRMVCKDGPVFDANEIAW
jgi:dihydroorotate dehydrogenase electron transfer subunit